MLDTLGSKAYTHAMQTGKEVLQALGSKIKDRRQRAGLSASALASSIGLTRAELVKAEGGELDISVLTLMRLLDRFKVDYDTFMSEACTPLEKSHQEKPKVATSPNEAGNMGSSKLKAIDLFAGIGGIRMGFDQAFKENIETVFVSEWDNYARKTYQANYLDMKPIAGDITRIDEKEIPEFDICLAGFPCQAFSLAGQRKGFNDDYKGISRGTLFFDVARICSYHRPKVIFCENVKGLTIHDKGRTFKIITGALEQMGYRVFHKVLNSKDFGVPQNRERIYIVAFREDIAPEKFRFPEPTGKKVTIRDIMEENPVSVRYYLSDVYIETLKRHKARHEAKGNGFGYEIRPLDSIAGAIVCGGMGRERNLIIDDRLTDFTPVTHIKGNVNREGIRKMTPREWARLQGFPDSYILPLSDVHLYKQFGNSVTVPVIRAIAEEIKKVIL